MSDARNSSNSLRGGGAKQTGGSGRTGRYAGGNNAKSELLAQNGLQAHAEHSEAKRRLQLQATSKQLAADMRTRLLEYHTAEEYQEYDIPLPSTDDARNKLKAMKEFTQKWYDKDFREEWLQTVTKVWLEELKAQYEAAVAARNGNSNEKEQQEEGEAMSIEELEEKIANLDVNTPPEERQRLKKKLKKKKQRAKDKEKEKAKKQNAIEN